MDRLLVSCLPGCFFLLLDKRADDDVVRAEQSHLLEDLLLSAATNGEHGDDGCHAEQDTE